MGKFSKILYYIFCSIGILLSIASILSVFRNSEIRYLKMLDFPRIQFFIALSITLIMIVLTSKGWKWQNILLIFSLVLSLLIHGYFLINYTKLVTVEVLDFKSKSESIEKISFLMSNVKMSNRNSEALVRIIEQKNPDLILVMEMDEWWGSQLNTLKSKFQNHHEVINDKAYGMALYSKLPLVSVETDYLNNENVPSFEVLISLDNGRKFTLHCLHPVPPTHYRDLPDNESQEETALKKIGNMVKERKYPSIVAGDLNDVVWSYVDRLTNTEDILFDIRVGRGFFNSYNSENIFVRWPLDHVLVTEEFELVKIEKLHPIGSDHFPIYVELALTSNRKTDSL